MSSTTSSVSYIGDFNADEGEYAAAKLDYYGDQRPTSRLPYQSKYWMFVIYPENLVKCRQAIQDMVISPNNPIIALRCQEEVCPTTGVTHFQCLLQFRVKKTKAPLKKLLYSLANRIAAVPALYPERALEYCQKEETKVPNGFEFDFGEFQFPRAIMSRAARVRENEKKEEAREIFEQFKDIIRESECKEEAYTECSDVDFQACKHHFDAAWTYVQYELKIARKGKKRQRMEDKEPNEWQRALLEELEEDADSRKIEVVLDYHGDAGKSFFADLATHKFPNEVAEARFGKTADMGHVLLKAIKNNGKGIEPRVVIVDCARFMVDKANLAVLEDLKNGRLHSPKYDSDLYVFDVIPHVVVMTNEPLTWSQMSQDRWRIWRVMPDPDMLIRPNDDPQRKLWMNSTYEIRDLPKQLEMSPPKYGDEDAAREYTNSIHWTGATLHRKAPSHSPPFKRARRELNF